MWSRLQVWPGLQMRRGLRLRLQHQRVREPIMGGGRNPSPFFRAWGTSSLAAKRVSKLNQDRLVARVVDLPELFRNGATQGVDHPPSFWSCVLMAWRRVCNDLYEPTPLTKNEGCGLLVATTGRMCGRISDRAATEVSSRPLTRWRVAPHHQPPPGQGITLTIPHGYAKPKRG